ncbi:hypothetical protein HPB48_018481 [Haemaphysalis longicornis]|uniref:Rab-GAP TBC domain-containing protein n=1 Tax=Haemaphysalis longicornis TaxID=44386 RepID=A0A9J6FBA9_HAELO|nr:hypothetical protein HPB48_018481 [Haemaphysalis longicornis]
MGTAGHATRVVANFHDSQPCRCLLRLPDSSTAWERLVRDTVIPTCTSSGHLCLVDPLQLVPPNTQKRILCEAAAGVSAPKRSEWPAVLAKQRRGGVDGEERLLFCGHERLAPRGGMPSHRLLTKDHSHFTSSLSARARSALLSDDVDRSLYEQFVDDMIVSNQEGGGTSPTEPDDHVSGGLCYSLQRNTKGGVLKARVAPSCAHTVLPPSGQNVAPGERRPYSAYFRDNEVLLQIDKDVRRLCPDMCFFQRPTEHPCTRIAANPRVQGLRERVQRSMLRAANVTRSRQGITNISTCVRARPLHEPLEQLGEGQEAHWEVVERILFLYAKLNPGLGYVQGMNEIIGPIYYTLVSDPDPEWRRHAEADCFFCFTGLMSEIRDFFIKTLDESSSGIGAMMERLMQLLRRRDDRLYGHLRQLQVEPQYYSFRWIMLLLSQDFPLPGQSPLPRTVCDGGLASPPGFKTLPRTP